LWQVISLLIVLFYAAGCLAAQNMAGLESLVLISIACIGAVLSIFGVVVQTCVPQFHSRLYRKQNHSHVMINFAFSFGKRAARYLEEHKRAIRSTLELESNARRAPVSDLSQSVQKQ